MFCFWYCVRGFFLPLLPSIPSFVPLSPIAPYQYWSCLAPPSPSSNQPTNQPTAPSSCSFFCNLLVFGISFKKNSQFFAITKTPQEISYTKKKGKEKKREEREKKGKWREKKETLMLFYPISFFALPCRLLPVIINRYTRFLIHHLGA